MLNTLQPSHPLIKRYIDSIYIFRRGEGSLSYTAYPSNHIAVALLRNASLGVVGKTLTISGSEANKTMAIAFNRFYEIADIHYTEMVDEIAINFTSLGFTAFTGKPVDKNKGMFIFSSWDAEIPALFGSLFATSDTSAQLAILETFLLNHYTPIAGEAMLLDAISQLKLTDTEKSIEDIAGLLGVNYKYLYRIFNRVIGCSPAHYRKITRFRDSIFTMLSRDKTARLTDICYEHNYTDQSYFTKEFRALTGDSPKKFFKDVATFGKGKIVFRFPNV